MKFKKFLRKFNKKLLKIISVSIILVSCLVIGAFPCYAAVSTDYWFGDGITLEFQNCFFWDHINRATHVTPVFVKDDSNHVTFKAELKEATTGNQLYIWCKIKDIESYYGWLHLKIVGHSGTFNFNLQDCGLYEKIISPTTGNETIKFGNPLLPFEEVGTSEIALHLTNKAPLPRDVFCIFLSWNHSFDTDVHLTTFELSYTQGYPYVDTQGPSNTLQTDMQLVEFSTEKLKAAMSDTDMLDFNNNLTVEMSNGVKALSNLFVREFQLIPSLRRILNLSFCIGFFAFLCGQLPSIMSSVSHSVRSKRFTKNNRKR